MELLTEFLERRLISKGAQLGLFQHVLRYLLEGAGLIVLGDRIRHNYWRRIALERPPRRQVDDPGWPQPARSLICFHGIAHIFAISTINFAHREMGAIE